MTRILEGLIKIMQERDSQIAYLMSKTEIMDESRQVGDTPPRQTRVSNTVTTTPRVLMPVETPCVTPVQEQALKNATASTNIPTSIRTI